MQCGQASGCAGKDGCLPDGASQETDCSGKQRGRLKRVQAAGCGRELRLSLRPYWQDSQVPPLRMASMEQAARSASVGSLAGRRSREALSIELLLRVRK
jgi:hypothetical protein